MLLGAGDRLRIVGGVTSGSLEPVNVSSDCGLTGFPLASDTPVIETRDLTVTFGSRHVLDRVNLRIGKGEIFEVMGPSGCGKTTLLKCLVRLLAPTSGAVLVDGRDVADFDEAASDDLRVKARPAWARLPLQKRHDWLGEVALRILYLGTLNGIQCWGAELPKEADAPPGMSWSGLRTLFSVLDDAHFALAGRALQIVDWDRNHQFCGRCGSRTEPHREERVRVCPVCKLSAYPRVAPAVMALVHRGDEVLLARSP